MPEFPRITIDPFVMSGLPCIRNLRIPVATIAHMLEGGMVIGEVLEAFPYLELEDVKEALLYDSMTMRVKLLRVITKKKEEIETLKSTLNAFVAGAGVFDTEVDEDTELHYVRGKPPKYPTQSYNVKIPVEHLETLRQRAQSLGHSPTEWLEILIINTLKRRYWPEDISEAAQLDGTNSDYTNNLPTVEGSFDDFGELDNE